MHLEAKKEINLATFLSSRRLRCRYLRDLNSIDETSISRNIAGHRGEGRIANEIVNAFEGNAGSLMRVRAAAS